MLKHAEKMVRYLGEKLALLATIILAAMMMLTVCDVSLRYFFAKPILGSAELTELMMVCVGFFGLAWCALQGGHVAVDILVSKFSRKKQRIFNIFNYLIVIGVSVIIGWQSFSRANLARGLSSTTSVLEMPLYPFILVVSFGFFTLIIASVILLVNVFTGKVEK